MARMLNIPMSLILISICVTVVIGGKGKQSSKKQVEKLYVCKDTEDNTKKCFCSPGGRKVKALCELTEKCLMKRIGTKHLFYCASCDYEPPVRVATLWRGQDCPAPPPPIKYRRNWKNPICIDDENYKRSDVACRCGVMKGRMCTLQEKCVEKTIGRNTLRYYCRSCRNGLKRSEKEIWKGQECDAAKHSAAVTPPAEEEAEGGEDEAEGNAKDGTDDKAGEGTDDKAGEGTDDKAEVGPEEFEPDPLEDAPLRDGEKADEITTEPELGADGEVDIVKVMKLMGVDPSEIVERPAHFSKSPTSKGK